MRATVKFMITLRIANVLDAPALSKIYEYYVTNTTISFEYVAPTSEEFADRIADRLKKYPFVVAEDNGSPVGYAYASEYRHRSAYDWSVELSIYVDKDERSCGIGTMLYSALLGLLKAQNFASAYACITVPNSPSVSFHEEMGFAFAGHLHAAGYKKGNWLDVVWYEHHLRKDEPPRDIIPFPLLPDETVRKILADAALEKTS